MLQEHKLNSQVKMSRLKSNVAWQSQPLKCLPDNLDCVVGDVKHCSIQSTQISMSEDLSGILAVQS